MAIYTPRGLKVRVPLDTAFALIARLHPRVDAFAVLKTTEAIELTAATVALITGATCFVLEAPPLVIAVAVGISTLVVNTLDRHAWLALSPLFFLARLYSYVSGYGLLIAVVAFGYWRTGWPGVAAFFLGKLCAAFINYAIDFAWTIRVARKLGTAFTASERHFYNAYRWHALRIGASADVNVTPEERDPAKWEHAYALLALKWPAVVRRFTNDDMPAV